MSEARREVRLTTEQVAIVLRRAAEIEAEAEAGGLADATAIDASAVEAAAEEVGLSPDAVRQAVAELQVGSLGTPSPDRGAPATTTAGRQARQARGARPGRPGRPGRPARRRGGPPSHVVSEQRIVPSAPATALALLDGLLREQMFAARRRDPAGAVFRPRDDMVAKLRRKLDFTGHIRLDGVAAVTTAATTVSGGTLVRLEAELLATRQSIVGGSAATGAATTLVTGVGGALFHEPGLVLMSFPAGAAVAAGGMRVRSRRWDEQRRDVLDALTILLDRL